MSQAYSSAVQRTAFERVFKFIDGSDDSLPCVMLLVSSVHHVLEMLINMRRQNMIMAASSNDLQNHLFSSITRFMSAPRSSSQLQRLLHSACTCQSDDRQNSWHILGQRAARGMRRPFEQFFDDIANLLASVLDLGLPEAHLMRADLAARRGTWPTDLRQLLPYGPEGTIRALFAWLQLDIGPAIRTMLVKIAELMIQYTWPATLPYILASRTLVISGIVATIHAAEERMAALPSQRQSAPHQLAEITPMLNFSCAALHECLSRSNEVQRRVFVQEYGPAVRDAAKRAAGTLHSVPLILGHPDPQSARLAEKFVECARAILHQEAVLRHGARRLADGDTVMPLWARLLEFLRNRAGSERCASPECTRTSLDAWPFKRCGGCRRTVYCSRRCQRIAWVHGVAPHRSACYVLREMCVKHKIPRSVAGIISSAAEAPDSFDRVAGLRLVDHFVAEAEYEVAKTGKRVHASPPLEAYEESRTCSSRPVRSRTGGRPLKPLYRRAFHGAGAGQAVEHGGSSSL
jgi:hypothetical protein